MDEEETKGFCRGCLKYCDEFMELLQYTEKNRRLFVYATGLQVKRNDTFKFQICKDCYLNMKIASKFKKQCRISDRRFKNFLALKGDGDNLDFKTFLRDNPVELRLPANSTPAHNKTRDEDDSIRNFITDMLQNEEIPDTESIIIRQVLEEETDVLDDSLDSHWLRDDISIASDLSLLTSFKPSTADSVKSARSANKNENIEQNESFLAFNEFLVPKSKRSESMKTQKNITEKVQQISTTADIIDNELSNGLNKFSQKRVVLKKDKNISTFNIKIDQSTGKKGSKSKVIKKIENGHNMFVKSNTNSDKDSECTIDRNLEKALKDEGIHEFSLENLLGSPKDLPGPSTPLMNNIILSGNVNIENDSSSYSISNAGKFIEKYKVVEGDTVLDDYFREDSSDKDGSVRKKIEIIENKIVNGGINVENHKISNKFDTKEPIQKPKELELNADDTLNCDFFEEIQNETLKVKKSEKQKVVSDDSKFCLKSFHCKICNNKYKNVRALKIHFCRFHKIQIKKANRKNSKNRMCPKCGMEVLSSQMNMHLKTHEDRSAQCDICKLWFTTKKKLTYHMTRHYLPASERQKIADKKKEFLCTICGTKISTYRNYLTHQQRHTKEYTKWCNICGMGFVTNYDLSEHSAKHSREKPFSCNLCPKRYSRKRCLNRHLESHMDTNLFECKYCSVALMNWDSVKRHMTSQNCLKLRRELGFENEDYFEAMRSYNRKQLLRKRKL